jgi:hypothetical protein
VSSAALFAQSGGSSAAQTQTHAIVPEAGAIVSTSIVATEHSWEARGHYTYTERDENRRLDTRGLVKSDFDVSRMILVNGARFEQLLEHNGHPPSTEERKKQDEALAELKHETPDERAARLRKDEENKSASASFTQS